MTVPPLPHPAARIVPPHTSSIKSTTLERRVNSSPKQSGRTAHSAVCEVRDEAVAAANKANSDHMAEEERQGLADFRQHANLDERQRLGIRFAEFQSNHLTGVKPVDKDPDAYIRDNA